MTRTVVELPSAADAAACYRLGGSVTVALVPSTGTVHAIGTGWGGTIHRTPEGVVRHLTACGRTWNETTPGHGNVERMTPLPARHLNPATTRPCARCWP